MAQLVFVHGVANRDVGGFEADVERRSERLRNALGGTATIYNPYWGGSAAKAAWQFASVPNMKTGYLQLGNAVAVPPAPPKDAVLTAARADFPAAIGALSVADLAQREESVAKARTPDARAKAKGEIAESERFWAAAAIYAEKYAEKSARPDWLDNVKTDEAFLTELEKQSSPARKDVALGFLNKFKRVIKVVGGILADGTNETAARAARQFSPDIGIFLGDAFAYLKDGDRRATIRAIVLKDIEEAARAAKEKEQKLIFAGHSFGGIILYDLLTDGEQMTAFEKTLGFPLKPDLYLTIGSQVALFEELKLYVSSDPSVPGTAKPPAKLKRPARVKHWWNVFDRMDVLSFLVEPVFEGAVDFYADTMAGVMSAHSAYFHNMVFYERLRVRLARAGLV